MMTSIKEKIAAGFRLPTSKEWESFLTPSGEKNDAEVYNVFYDKVKVCWSSTLNPDHDKYANVFNLSHCVLSMIHVLNMADVRLVRRCPNFKHELIQCDTKPRFMVSECRQYVLDRKSGLEWMRDIEKFECSWQKAIDTFGAIEEPKVDMPESADTVALLSKLVESEATLRNIKAENQAELAKCLIAAIQNSELDSMLKIAGILNNHPELSAKDLVLLVANIIEMAMPKE